MRTTNFVMMFGAAALALGGCGKKDEGATASGNNVAFSEGNVVSPATGNETATADLPGQDFANAAAASDAFEIASSKLALASSSSPAVKKFAQRMIDAHTQSTAKLKSAAAGASPAITPDPALAPDQQAALDGMKGKTGGAFDQAYIAAQRDGHQKTLDALRGYATSGDVPALQAFAKATSPIVAAHLNMANSLKP
jgi:putative membrane protein